MHPWAAQAVPWGAGERGLGSAGKPELLSDRLGYKMEKAPQKTLHCVHKRAAVSRVWWCGIRCTPVLPVDMTQSFFSWLSSQPVLTLAQGFSPRYMGFMPHTVLPSAWEKWNYFVVQTMPVQFTSWCRKVSIPTNLKKKCYCFLYITVKKKPNISASWVKTAFTEEAGDLGWWLELPAYLFAFGHTLLTPSVTKSP